MRNFKTLDISIKPYLKSVGNFGIQYSPQKNSIAIMTENNFI